jgi:glycerol kinase
VFDVLPVGVDKLRADGGASANRFLMQFQADLIRCPVEAATDAEATALGAAALAGLGVGVWRSVDEVRDLVGTGLRFEPTMDPAEAAEHRAAWREALARV